MLITNTFAAGPGPLAAAGYAARVDEANVNAVLAAAAAREQVGRDDVVILGSMSRMVANGLSRSESVDAGSANEDRLRDAFGRQARILADAGVDALALEMIGAKAQAMPAVAAAAETGLPVWLGISVVEATDGRATTVDGEDVAGLIESVRTEAIDAVLVMHTDTRLVSDSLSVITAVWPGTVGAYPRGVWGLDTAELGLRRSLAVGVRRRCQGLGVAWRHDRGRMLWYRPRTHRRAGGHVRAGTKLTPRERRRCRSQPVSGGSPFAIRSTPKTRNSTVITAALWTASQPFIESSSILAWSPPTR